MHFFSPLGIVEYSHDRMPKKNAPANILPMDVFRCVVDDLYLWYCVEGVVIFHEGTDALADVPYLDADIPQESTAFPKSHDNDCFWVHFS